MLPPDNPISLLVCDVLLRGCVEVITRPDIPLHAYREALIVLASHDFGPWGDVARKKISARAKELAEQIIRRADERRTHAFVITLHPITGGDAVLFGDVPPAQARTMLSGFGAGLFGAQRWGQA